MHHILCSRIIVFQVFLYSGLGILEDMVFLNTNLVSFVKAYFSAGSTGARHLMVACQICDGL